jgi:hypothetical protein
MSNSEKSWLDTLSEILTQPLPGTEQKAEVPQPPVIHTDDEDDDSLLDSITDILTQPLPGTEMPEAEAPVREDQGEAAVKEAADCSDDQTDPAVTTGAAGADWMQREYERFNGYQEQSRQSFAERQRYEQERFFEYQKRQLDQFAKSQMREQGVFRNHQQARFHAWRSQMQHHYVAQGMRPEPPRPGMIPPPPPPPWWRNKG